MSSRSTRSRSRSCSGSRRAWRRRSPTASATRPRRPQLMSDLPPTEPGLSPETAKEVGVVAKGGAVQIAGQIADRGLSAIFSIVAVQILGTAGYGLYRQVRQMLILAAQVGLAG